MSLENVNGKPDVKPCGLRFEGGDPAGAETGIGGCKDAMIHGNGCRNFSDVLAVIVLANPGLIRHGADADDDRRPGETVPSVGRCE